MHSLRQVGQEGSEISLPYSAGHAGQARVLPGSSKAKVTYLDEGWVLAIKQRVVKFHVPEGQTAVCRCACQYRYLPGIAAGSAAREAIQLTVTEAVEFMNDKTHEFVNAHAQAG